MNHMIIFFVGCAVFALMLFIKIPVKRLNERIADTYGNSAGEREAIYRRCNAAIFVIAILVAIIVYYMVLRWLGETHFKLCCALKAWAFATAFYAIFEQIFGEERQGA